MFLVQVNHQLGANRNARHQLERDLANKDQAISIGTYVYSLTVTYNNFIPLSMTIYGPSAFINLVSLPIFLHADHTCHQLQNQSRGINVHGGIEKMDPNVSIPDTWAENSNHNIQESQGTFHSKAVKLINSTWMTKMEVIGWYVYFRF